MLTLELEDEVGTLGIRERSWIVRRNGDVLGQCDDRDDPENPIFWEIPGFDPEDHSCFRQKQNLADFFRFAQRL